MNLIIGRPPVARKKLRTTLLLILLVSASANAESLDDYAASLLCDQTPECEQKSNHEDSESPLTVHERELPSDASRQHNEEQRFLVPQGAYVTEDGEIASLDGEFVEVAPPDREGLHAPDHGVVEDLPVRGPVIITTPEDDKRE